MLHGLADKGNTVLIIEHNLDVIKTADWLIDLGPEGGDKGGRIVCEGTPREVAAHPGSYTGKYLKKELAEMDAFMKAQHIALAARKEEKPKPSAAGAKKANANKTSAKKKTVKKK